MFFIIKKSEKSIGLIYIFIFEYKFESEILRMKT